MSSRQEQWAAELKANREQQLKDAAVLLLLVQDALEELDFPVLVFTDRLKPMIMGTLTAEPLKETTILQVVDGDYWVPEIQIHPADARFRSKSSDAGKLEVFVDGVYYPYHIRRKTFARSKARAGTFGFDVQAIAQHLVAFVDAKRTVEKQRELQKNSIEMWRKVCERLAAEFPEAKDLTPTGGGIRISAVVGEREARAALQAIYRAKTKGDGAQERQG
jgi:hypothetical protein